jgi:hypothetical protein
MGRRRRPTKKTHKKQVFIGYFWYYQNFRAKVGELQHI